MDFSLTGANNIFLVATFVIIGGYVLIACLVVAFAFFKEFASIDRTLAITMFMPFPFTLLFMVLSEEFFPIFYLFNHQAISRVLILSFFVSFISFCKLFARVEN